MTNPLPATTGVTRDGRAITLAIAIDDCESCWHAVSYATGLARRQPGGAHAVFFWFDRPIGSDAAAALISDAMAGTGLSWEFQTRRGNRLKLLRAAARSMQVDAIVVGTGCRVAGWGSRRLAVALLAASDCPVIAVP